MSSKRRRAAGDDGGTERGMKPYSQPASTALERAGELEGRMRHLNDKYFEWVKEQHSSAPTALWTAAAKEYCQYVEKLLEEFSDTVAALQEAEVMPGGGESTRQREQDGASKAGKPPVYPQEGSRGAASGAAAAPPSAGAAPSASFSFGPVGGDSVKENTGDKQSGGAFAPGAFSFGGASTSAAATPSMPLFGATPSGSANDGAASSGPLFGAIGAAGANASTGSSIWGASSSALFATPNGANEAATGNGAGSSGSAAKTNGAADTAQAGGFGGLGKSDLFGGTNASSGLFGASAASSGGSIFGSSLAPPSGSLFSPSSGGAAGGVSSMSLFAPGASTGSLFGSAGTAAASGGAFGGNIFGGQSAGGAFAGLGEADAGADAGEADEEAEEQTAPVKLKGTGDTEILFEGKAKALFLEQPGKWSEAGVVGTLTVRKHKGSGAHWLQINSEQGRILSYLGVPAGKAGRVTVRDVPVKEGPPRNTTHTLSLQKFKSAPEAGQPPPATEAKVTNIKTVADKSAELQKALESAGFTVAKGE